MTSCLAVRPPVHPAERATGVTDWTLPSVAQSPSPLLRVTPSLLLPLALRATDLKQQQELQQREQTKAAGAIRRHETRPERPLPPPRIGTIATSNSKPALACIRGLHRSTSPPASRLERRRALAATSSGAPARPDPWWSRLQPQLLPHSSRCRPSSALGTSPRRTIGATPVLSLPPPVISALVSGPRRS